MLLSVSIENLQALEEIDAIASTEGVDVIMVGPVYLSRALGVTGQEHHPKLIAPSTGSVRRSRGVGKRAYPYWSDTSFSTHCDSVERDGCRLRQLCASSRGSAS